MQQTQAGNRAAYAQLLCEITPLLRQAVRQRRSFLKPEDAEDILQNILLALHKGRAAYDPDRSFLHWLFAIARNQIADSARRYVRRVSQEISVADIPEAHVSSPMKIDSKAFGEDEALKSAIGDLPASQQRAIEMLKLKEMTLNEAAAASGLTKSALKVSVHRAILTLRKALSAEG